MTWYFIDSPSLNGSAAVMAGLFASTSDPETRAFADR
jgi:hypothetical protein